VCAEQANNLYPCLRLLQNIANLFFTEPFLLS
jgi:hypothetical protein